MEEMSTHAHAHRQTYTHEPKHKSRNTPKARGAQAVVLIRRQHETPQQENASRFLTTVLINTTTVLESSSLRRQPMFLAAGGLCTGFVTWKLRRLSTTTAKGFLGAVCLPVALRRPHRSRNAVDTTAGLIGAHLPPHRRWSSVVSPEDLICTTQSLQW